MIGRYWKTGVLLVLISVESSAIDISRVSVSSTGVEGNNSSRSTAISSDGRYVAFESFSNNLVADDTNNEGDVFVHDRDTGITIRISVTTNGAEGNLESLLPSLSSNGRYVSFSSLSSNLVPGDTNAAYDVFVHDRDLSITTRVSVATNGTEGNGLSANASISSDGRYVVFSSSADNLVVGDTNTASEIFIHDRNSGVTNRISAVVDGVELLGHLYGASFSSDNRYIVFMGSVTPPTPNSTIVDKTDIYIYDRNTKTTSLVSKSTDGVIGNLESFDPSLSFDGRYVVFTSAARNLIIDDTNRHKDVFIHDRDTGETTRVSVTSTGAEATGSSGFASLSSDGRYVTFSSNADNLLGDIVQADINNGTDVFIHDRLMGSTTRVSEAPNGTGANGTSDRPSYSANGRYLAFLSDATNLVSADTNQKSDIFVADLVNLTGNSAPNDFDGNGRSDVFWRNPVTYANKVYLMNGNLIDAETDINIPPVNAPHWKVVGNGDFNNDGHNDILWRNNTTGLNHISLMNGTETPVGVDLSIPALSDQKWKLVGVDDFSSDGNDDLFWHHDNGENRITFMNGTTPTSTVSVNTISDPNWKVAGIADFNNDGKADVLWRNSVNRRVWLYLMDGSTIINGAGEGEHVAYTSANWNIEGVGDFDTDGNGDILWRHNTNGRVWMYLMNGPTVANGSSSALGEHVAYTSLTWDIEAIGDYDGDGKQDIFWRNSVTGQNHMYQMNGEALKQAGGLPVNSLSDLNWMVGNR